MKEKILNYIKESTGKFGYPPTRRAIAKNFKTSPQRIDYYIQLLLNEGIVKKIERIKAGNIISV